MDKGGLGRSVVRKVWGGALVRGVNGKDGFDEIVVEYSLNKK